MQNKLNIDLLFSQLVGGNAKFEAFMKTYIQHFAFQAINSKQFKAFFLEQFGDLPQVSEIDWETWYYGRGITLTAIVESNLHDPGQDL